MACVVYAKLADHGPNLPSANPLLTNSEKFALWAGLFLQMTLLLMHL